MTYSVKLAGAVIGPSFSTIYTAPATDTIVVRDIELYNNGTAAGRAVVVVGVPGSGNVYLLGTPSLPIGNSYHWDGRVVLDHEATLGCFTDGQQFTIYVSGYDLA